MQEFRSRILVLKKIPAAEFAQRVVKLIMILEITEAAQLHGMPSQFPTQLWLLIALPRPSESGGEGGGGGGGGQKLF